MHAQTGALHLDLSEKNQAFAHQSALRAEPVRGKQRWVGNVLQNLTAGLCQYGHADVVYGQLQFP